MSENEAKADAWYGDVTTYTAPKGFPEAMAALREQVPEIPRIITYRGVDVNEFHHDDLLRIIFLLSLKTQRQAEGGNAK